MPEVIDETRVKYLINLLQQQRNQAQNNLLDSLVEQRVLKDEIARLTRDKDFLEATLHKKQQAMDELQTLLIDYKKSALSRDSSHPQESIAESSYCVLNIPLSSEHFVDGEVQQLFFSRPPTKECVVNYLEQESHAASTRMLQAVQQISEEDWALLLENVASPDSDIVAQGVLLLAKPRVPQVSLTLTPLKICQNT